MNPKGLFTSSDCDCESDVTKKWALIKPNAAFTNIKGNCNSNHLMWTDAEAFFWRNVYVNIPQSYWPSLYIWVSISIDTILNVYGNANRTTSNETLTTLLWDDHVSMFCLDTLRTWPWDDHVSMFCLDTLRTWLWDDHVSMFCVDTLRTWLWDYHVSMFCLDTLRTWLWDNHVSMFCLDTLRTWLRDYHVSMFCLDTLRTWLWDYHVSMFCLDTLRTWLWDCWRSVTVRMRSEQGWCWFVKWNSSVWYTYTLYFYEKDNRKMLSIFITEKLWNPSICRLFMGNILCPSLSSFRH